MDRSFSVSFALVVSLVAGCAPVEDEPAAVTQAVSLVGGWAGAPTPVIDAPGAGEWYRYAPSVVQVSPTVRFAYSCANARSGDIQDFIRYRAATFSNGAWTWSGEGATFGPTADRWDSMHVCDPEYVQGDFRLNGRPYRLAMFYTGNDVPRSEHNQVGVAFANDAAGPWVKYARPAVPYACAGHERQWGTGQPSATAVAGGRVLVFYTVGCGAGGPSPAPYSTDTYRAELDLGDVWDGAPIPVRAPALRVPTDGLTKRDGSPDPVLHNASFVYDGARDFFWAVRTGHDVPAGYLVSDFVQVAYIPGAAIWSGSGRWTVAAAVAPSSAGWSVHGSGFAQNDNAALARNPYGGMIDRGFLDVYFTTSHARAFPADLFTYRVRSQRLRLY